MKGNSLIIIPTYNESENIELIISKILLLNDSNDILVVDDNSPDGTAAIVDDLILRYSNCLFIEKREGKNGLGTAYIHGFKWAIEKKYDYIIGSGNFTIKMHLDEILNAIAKAYELSNKGVAFNFLTEEFMGSEDHMFLPAYIHEFFDHATFKDNDTAVVGQSILAYKQTKQPKSNYFLISPIVVFGLIGLFILLITYKDFKSNQRSKWLDLALFSITGIIGLVILLLWFATDHKATHQNYNLLWACALNLVVIGQLLRQTPKNWFIKYLKFLVIMLCLLTLHWIIGVQVFAFGLIPLLIALIIRYLYLITYYTNAINSQ